jgi:hypothetical protein
VPDEPAYPNRLPEKCAWCKGSGSYESAGCLPCGGEGHLLVKQPSEKCRYCGGSGVNLNRIDRSSWYCWYCHGTGWEGVERVQPD